MTLSSPHLLIHSSISLILQLNYELSLLLGQTTATYRAQWFVLVLPRLSANHAILNRSESAIAAAGYCLKIYPANLTILIS